MILATAEGRELQEQADHMQMNLGDREKFQNTAKKMTEEFRAALDIIEIDALTILEKAADASDASKFLNGVLPLVLPHLNIRQLSCLARLWWSCQRARSA